MKKILLCASSFILVSQLIGYEATIVNHTPWQLKGRPTRAWSQMDDRIIEPYQKTTWDSGIALVTGITLDFVFDTENNIKEILKETYVGRAIGVTYHIFAEPFLDEKNNIKKIKLLLVREPAGTTQKTIYPGGIIKESKEIDLTSIKSQSTKNAPIAQASTKKLRLQKMSASTSACRRLASAR